MLASPVEDATEAAVTSPVARRWFVISVIAAVVPVVVAAVRAIATDWIPLGDNGLIILRANDVLRPGHIPLLGTWTSASLSAGINVNNPGPALFDVLAIPARFGSVGVIVGVSSLNILAIIAIAIVARRNGGIVVATIAMTTTATLCWAMGNDLLYDPWQPHAMLLPFLALLFMTAGLVHGDLVLAPWTAALASLIVQTHLSYVVLVLSLIVATAVGLWMWQRRTRADAPDAWPALRRRAGRITVLTGIVALICWVQPVIEQIRYGGDGNMARLVDVARDGHAGTVGGSLGIRLFANVVALPPWWFRPGFDQTFSQAGDWQPPGFAVALMGLVLVAAIMAWAVWDTKRRRDRASCSLVAVACVALAAGLVTTIRVPIETFGIDPHVFRWMWPLAAFATCAVVVTLSRRFAPSRHGLARVVAGFAVLTVIIAALNLPATHCGGHGPNSQQYANTSARRLVDQVPKLEHKGPLLIDDLFMGRFADPYGGSVVQELGRVGIPFVADDAGLVRQLGPARALSRSGTARALFLRTGEAARQGPPGTRRVAFVPGLDARERRELQRVRAEVAQDVREKRLRLNQRGRVALDRGQLDVTVDGRGFLHDADALLESGALIAMVHEDQLAPLGRTPRVLARYVDLQSRWDDQTVALFLGPVEEARELRAS